MMTHPDDAATWPVLICLLGDFRLLKAGQYVELSRFEKTKALLCILAIRYDQSIPRDALFSNLWPDIDSSLASQSLNSLVYKLHRLLGDAIGGAVPVLHANDCYRLNVAAGVGVDKACFEALARAGGAEARAGNHATAMVYYDRAVGLYRGDLCACDHEGTILEVERERLRALYRTLLKRLAEHFWAARDFATCLDYAQRLLLSDPCRVRMRIGW